MHGWRLFSPWLYHLPKCGHYMAGVHKGIVFGISLYFMVTARVLYFSGWTS